MPTAGIAERVIAPSMKSLLKFSLIVCFSLACFGVAASRQADSSPAAAALSTQASRTNADDSYVGSAACASCHADLFKMWRTTPMANSSGPARPDDPALKDGRVFTHAPAEVNFAVAHEGGRVFLEFERAASLRFPALSGRRSVDFFIGSGAHGRSFLTQRDGFLFQLPVSWYSSRQRWDMSPGQETRGWLKLGRPVPRGCLECHATRLRPIDGTFNRYEAPPFLDNGIGCERCHGPGARHIALMKSGVWTGDGKSSPLIINPAKLEPARRDGICAQCHLAGEARVNRTGRSLLSFRPGDLLSDHVVAFVNPETRRDHEIAVTGHVERLAQSRCFQQSAGRMWCASCHNPHRSVAPAEAAAYFRQKCLTCHTDSSCRAPSPLRLARQNDCLACHMPKKPTADVSHSVFTDHSIPRLPSTGVRTAYAPTLIPFWKTDVKPRDLALALLVLSVKTGNTEARRRAFDLLRQAEPELTGDGEALTELSKLYEEAKQPARAQEVYEKAVRLRPIPIEAALHLGSIYYRARRLKEAAALWKEVVARHPALEVASLNLALAYIESGDAAAARATLYKALEYEPDLAMARRLLSSINELQR